jgi:hypothetical protein
MDNSLISLLQVGDMYEQALQSYIDFRARKVDHQVQKTSDFS